MRSLPLVAIVLLLSVSARAGDAPTKPDALRGLKTEIFVGTGFTDLKAMRVEPMVSAFHHVAGPLPDLPSNFSIRWSGFLVAPSAGRYRLIAAADEQMKVSLDGQVILAEHNRRGHTDVDVELSGRPQAIRVEYANRKAGGFSALRWVPAGERNASLVPPECFFQTADAAARLAKQPYGRAGNGLKAEIFAGGRALSQVIGTRVDAWISHDFALGAPMPGAPADRFGVRWTGVIKASAAGSYRITALADDGVRVYVNDKMVLDHWTPGAHREAAIVELPGRAVPFKVEYFDGDKGGWIALYWERTDGSTKPQLIPAKAYFQSAAAAAAAAKP